MISVKIRTILLNCYSIKVNQNYEALKESGKSMEMFIYRRDAAEIYNTNTNR